MIDNNETGLPSDGGIDADNAFLRDYEVKTRLHTGIYILFAIIFLALAVLLAYQTQESTELMGRRYARPELPKQVSDSTRLRHEARMSQLPKGAPVPEPAIKLHDILFSQYPKQRKLLMDTITELLKDQTINNNFLTYPICDGLPLEKTSAIIVPLSTLDHPGDRKQMGITEAAYLCLKEEIDDKPDGMTIREFPKDPACMRILSSANHQYLAASDGTPRMTTDGIPRIPISASVVSEYKLDRLKLTLMHEFLHAHEAPAYRPLLNWAHDDLTYLSEYNNMISSLNLNSNKRLLNCFLWGSSMFGLLLAFIQVYLALGGDSRPWAWVGWSNNTVGKRVTLRRSRKRQS
jgi:hypothetical protein